MINLSSSAERKYFIPELIITQVIKGNTEKKRKRRERGRERGRVRLKLRCVN